MINGERLDIDRPVLSAFFGLPNFLKGLIALGDRTKIIPKYKY